MTAFSSVVAVETTAAAQFVAAPPPPLRHERIPPRPYRGGVWIGGYWGYAPNSGYAWHSGRWARGRPGFSYVPPRWVRSPRGWQLRPGYWR
jgi:hypothetical protein